MSDTNFCIDIGDKYTRIVDSTVKDNKITLNALGDEHTVPNYFVLDDEQSIENEAISINKIITDLKISKKSVHIIIPDSYTFSQILEISKLSEKELLSAIKYQADQFIPMPIDDVGLDIEVLSEDKIRKKMNILIVASPKNIIQRIEKTIELAGLIPESLENELSAIGRFVSSYLKFPPKNNAVIVNFGYISSAIYLVDTKTSLITVARTLKLGLDLFIKELKLNLQLQETKALELLKTIGFEQNSSYDLRTYVAPILTELTGEIQKFILISKEKFQTDVDTVYLFNHGTSILSLDKELSTKLNIAVSPFSIQPFLINNPISNSFSHEMSSFISAIAGNIS